MKQRRKELDFTQIELAETAGCSIDSVRKIEAGSLRPSRQLAELLAKALKIEPDTTQAFVTFARTGESGQMFAKQETKVPAEPSSPFDSAFDTAQPPTNMPVALSPFIGRENEVARIHTLLWQSSVRLVTLMGPPGIGKTRTAVEAATRLMPDYPHGAFFVPLAPVTEPERVWSTLARTLDLEEAPDVPIFETLRAYLRPRKMLLIMDNFEQVMGAASGLVELMVMAPQVKVIVTSREALRVRGEKAMVMPLMGLPNPDDAPLNMMESEAVALFVQRAQDINIDFALDDSNARSVAAICHKLDGLPLALELAATRLEVLSPQGLLERLEHRLAVLQDGLRDLPPHQRTLRHAIDWSYSLLSSTEQAIFRRMSVFAGGSTMPAVEFVAEDAASSSDVLKNVASLVSKSLLQRATDKYNEPRFGMLEAIKEYATELLNTSGEVEEVGLRHAQFYLEMAKESKPQLLGSNSIEWLRKLESEQNNLHNALEWWLKEARYTVASDPETWVSVDPILEMAGALGHYWTRHGHINEGQVWLRRALAAVDAMIDSGVRAEELSEHTQKAWSAVLLDMGVSLYYQGEYAETVHYYSSALPITQRLGDKLSLARALHNIGTVSQLLLRFDEALNYYEESLALVRELGEKRLMAHSINSTATILHSLNKYKEAQALYRESLEICRELDDKLMIATILGNLAMLSIELQEYEPAHSILEESLALHKLLGSREGLARTLKDIGDLALHKKEYKEARRNLDEGLLIHHEMKVLYEIAQNLEVRVRLMLALSKPEQATIFLGAFTGIREVMQHPMGQSELAPYQELMVETHRQLEPTTWERAWARGQALSNDLDALVAYALTE